MGKRIILLWTAVMLGQAVHSQDIQPRGQFLQDSLKIGEEIQFSLAVQYPKNWQVIFPDSTFDFSPFEFSKKKYSPTHADSTLAYDSVIYTISSFEIDLIQRLQLPMYIIQQNDSIEILSNFDSVYLQEMVAVLPDSIILRNNLDFQALHYDWNYLYIGIGAAILLILLVGSYFLFGKNLRAKYRLYLLKKDYERFVLQFENAVNQVKANHDNTHTIEAAVLLWKKFMERLEDRPFTKYTSKEILLAGYGDGLKDVLKKIDQSIYGKVAIDDIHSNLEALNHYTAERYELKREEVKHA
ncbi:hypothetical protein N6H18_11865 [Reichenbachiella agarivorans]|uniref:Oxygen tolerance n=1 Tax=Reichenbachiella agarivorans TaxID=2979464 RepID=A0ABY6CKJ7_9BACT|nr:hypothetical protein [Reichenbachiella agarivorans]UXP31046.1 hypothetical protein N6H18_11865 [Reichenbachiella agarivorans]